MDSSKIFTTTSESIPKYQITKVIGVITKSIVEPAHEDLYSNIPVYPDNRMMEIEIKADICMEAAINALKEQAAKKGANAIVGLRLSYSVHYSHSFFAVYGTAVIAESDHSSVGMKP